MANVYGDIRIMIREMQRGSLEAFEHFYIRYAPLVYRAALKITQDPMEAEEVCQDVFLEALQKIAQYDPTRGSIEAWLTVRARCRSLDRVRKKSRLHMQTIPAETAVDCEAHSENVEEAVIKEIERQTLVSLLENIPFNQRQAIYNIYYEARSYEEVADRWERPLGTVKSWVRYGIHNLKKQFAQAGWI